MNKLKRLFLKLTIVAVLATASALSIAQFTATAGTRRADCNSFAVCTGDAICGFYQKVEGCRCEAPIEGVRHCNGG
jgi:hypothetical protein